MRLAESQSVRELLPEDRVVGNAARFLLHATVCEREAVHFLVVEGSRPGATAHWRLRFRVIFVVALRVLDNLTLLQQLNIKILIKMLVGEVLELVLVNCLVDLDEIARLFQLFPKILNDLLVTFAHPRHIYFFFF